jgi:hypothetical protein
MKQIANNMRLQHDNAPEPVAPACAVFDIAALPREMPSVFCRWGGKGKTRMAAVNFVNFGWISTASSVPRWTKNRRTSKPRPSPPTPQSSQSQ